VESFDEIVVGGGPAGCVLAARLSEDGRTVCLVEAGPDYGPRSAGRWPGELLDPSVIPDSHDWSDGDHTLPWARVLGGCSAHNACAITRGAAADYDAWQDAGGAGWSWATLEPCLRRAREALGVRARGEAGIGVWHAAVLESAVEAGLPRLDDLDAERLGVGVAATNVAEGARHNAAFAYLDAARARSNLSILGDTLVDRVVVDRTARATGAVVRGRAGERTLHAGRVVLAAGAYGSPAVLLRSGIGPEDELRAHAIRPRDDLPGVGLGLADHCRAGIGFGLRAEVTAAMRADRGDRAIAVQCIAKWASSRAAEDPWDVQFLAIVPPDRSTGRITTGLLAPRSRGRVRLAARDPARLPRVEPGFLSDHEGHDIAVLAEGIGFARALARTRALQDHVTREIDPGPEIDSTAHARANVTSFYHPTGTCRLGRPGDRYAVVDSSAGVHGLERLHVADASIAPRPVRAGTYLTALAIAERVAELLLTAA
jgi:choline dehydrogenase